MGETDGVPYTRLPRPTLWLLRGDGFRMGGEFDVDVLPFYISKSPLTNEEYGAFDPRHPRDPASPGNDDPVVGVSFEDAQRYCHWYSELSGKPFRLPTEVEWEFACRAGTDTRYYWGDSREGADGHLWDVLSSAGRCHRVETRRPNQFGLYDMLGNVWEWTSSLYLPYPVLEGDRRDEPDRTGPRSIRGGSFRTEGIGSSTRRSLEPTERRDDVGFRIVRPLG